MKIIHISDLHISSEDYVPKWGEKVIDLINSMQPEVLVVTGDLTDKGYLYEYEMVAKYFDKIKVKNILAVPGNHDSRNRGYEIFEEIFETRFPLFESENVAVLGVDSSEPDLNDGHIGRENYPCIEENLSDGNKVRILAMHHHLIPLPGTGREKNIPTDAGDLLKLCTKLKMNFVISGHKHQPWIWKLEDTYLITAGTATTLRLKGRSYPSFNVLEIEKEKVILKEVNVADKKSVEILRVKI